MAERPSAAQEALSKVEDQLSCLVCLEPYTNPRLLSCFHVYCQHCLEDIVAHNRHGQLECPKCRRPTPLPPTGVSGLQAAFHVHHLFDIQETLKKVKEPQKLACEKCVKTTRKATSFCRQCTKFICEKCTDTHKEWEEEFEGHEVVTIEKLEGDLIRLVSPKKTSPRCPKHDDIMRLYCETCGELICINCTVQIHKNHKYCVIADTFESHKKEILDSLGPVDKQLEATDTALVNLDGRHAELVEHSGKLATNIHSKFDEIHQALYAREGELMAELEGHTQQQLKSLSAQREEVEILQTQRSSCLHFVRESIRTGSPGDVLKMKQGVVKQVRELVDTFDPNTLEPRETTNTFFVPSAQLVKDCKQSGTICTTSVTATPTKRLDKTRVQEAASLRFSNTNHQLIQFPSSNIEAKLFSKLTNKPTYCVVKERGKGEYEISYQPTVGGASEMIVRVGGEEVAGSPFPVAVKTPIDKLGTVIKTINDLKSPWGVALNQAGEIIVAEEGAGIVSIFSPTGDKLRTLDTRGTAVGEMKSPRGVAVDGDDNILVVDAGNHRLLKFSRGGDQIAAVGSHGNSPGQFNDPIGVCVNSVNVKVYVVDWCAECVQIFNSDLTFSSKFGSEGSGNGQFSSPYDVASDRSGCVYVVEYISDRVHVFTPNGVYLRQFGKNGSGNGELNYPVSICVDSDDLVYVGENGNNRVSVFTCEGVFLKSFGSKRSGSRQFKDPVSMVTCMAKVKVRYGNSATVLCRVSGSMGGQMSSPCHQSSIHWS
ncbi:tripartite motif-containing protein 2-like isoform X2 [Halichondria panicea]|uniref:tripartite motif-containing protein 2-like isoform X2 n=1 Tax=Halichondria panicea TaxID=6063 RepID=UPI00312B8579